jgi:hypothetical protein
VLVKRDTLIEPLPERELIKDLAVNLSHHQTDPPQVAPVD